MSEWECSMCGRRYDFDQYMKLVHEWIDPKNKKMYGKMTICKCGKSFLRDKWQIKSRKEGYEISTVHLEMGHGSTTDITDFSQDYYYETMIYDTKNNKWLDFQMRYKKREDAIKGHEQAYKQLSKILLNPQSYPMSIISAFCNAMQAVEQQKKTIRPSVKERLT